MILQHGAQLIVYIVVKFTVQLWCEENQISHHCQKHPDLEAAKFPESSKEYINLIVYTLLRNESVRPPKIHMWNR